MCWHAASVDCEATTAAMIQVTHSPRWWLRDGHQLATCLQEFRCERFHGTAQRRTNTLILVCNCNGCDGLGRDFKSGRRSTGSQADRDAVCLESRSGTGGHHP